LKRKLCPSVALLVSCTLFLAAPARAAEEPSRNPAKRTVVKSRGSAGLRAYIDPATGQLREPTPEESRALSRPTRAIVSPKELQAVRHANGMTSVDLKDAFLMDLVARRNADGSISIDCAPRSRETAPLPAPFLEER
jgi:hypothetical protein